MKTSKAVMKRLKVLIVDDDPGVGGLAQLVLERAAHHVTLVSSVIDALSLVRRICFEVLLTDILIGHEDALEVVREMRLIQPLCRIIAMSGGGAQLATEFCSKLGAGFGATALLKKPFTPNELLAAVEGRSEAPDEGGVGLQASA